LKAPLLLSGASQPYKKQIAAGLFAVDIGKLLFYTKHNLALNGFKQLSMSYAAC